MDLYMASSTSTVTPAMKYKYIESAAITQINRLYKSEEGAFKALHIVNALKRLSQGVLHKYRDITIDPAITTHLVRDEVHGPFDAMDLSTVDAMLDAKIQTTNRVLHSSPEGEKEYKVRIVNEISLRQALNIARNNLFNGKMGTWGPLWGRAKALISFEDDLHKSLRSSTTSLTDAVGIDVTNTSHITSTRETIVKRNVALLKKTFSHEKAPKQNRIPYEKEEAYFIDYEVDKEGGLYLRQRDVKTGLFISKKDLVPIIIREGSIHILQADGTIKLEPPAIRYHYAGPGHIDDSDPSVAKIKGILNDTIVAFVAERSV